uniref:Uncharacterized protein n=1 Tax=Meloidogyne hapla TaxID=6305 RepID=A0A1I8BMX1_MELHA
MPKIWNLFRKSKYYLVNVHNIEKYLIPETSTRIVDIAGIEIEIEKIIKEKERKDKIEEENKNVLKKIFKPALGAVVNAFSMNKDWIIK